MAKGKSPKDQSLPDALQQKEIEVFELIIDAAKSVDSDGFLDSDSRNSSPHWKAGYRASMEDLAEYLQRKVDGLKSSSRASDPSTL